MHPPVALSTMFSATKRRWLRVGLVVLLLLVVGLGALALGVASLFRLSSDARAVQSDWARATGCEGRKQVGVSLGSITLAAARAGLSLGRLEPEARAAVRAVRSVELGVWERSSASQHPGGLALLAAADKVLRSRGWERVVAVQDGQQTFGVYWSARSGIGNRMESFVVVLNRRHMVLAHVQADLRPLLQCLQNRAVTPHTNKPHSHSPLQLSSCEPWQIPLRPWLATWL